MLQVYERAYRLYVVTYKICQMLQRWDKVLSTSTSPKLHRTVELLYDQVESDRVLKWWRHKKEISEIMGFVRIFWKDNLQEAYLPKMSISRQIVSEMLAGYTQKTPYIPLKLNLIEIELFIKMLYGDWSSLKPDHETNKSPRRMQVNPPARNDDRSSIWNIWRTLVYLFSSEDKCKGLSLHQREDWLIDCNQLQLCQF